MLRAKDLVKQILTFSRQMETRRPGKNPSHHQGGFEAPEVFVPSTITITEHIDTASGTVFADSTQIHQVII